ncbi:hypothetical protein [Sphingomonas sp. CARO-RG-8B-R24-01]|uniref:hypothetical protein n=1 Tax=Sphingomonas sp. CARO-RG-8B-R24-01 TaxID=2914831 RepID=UPI001F579ECC|nr:hypothetical protein [Sphingomonas sp. CARO-RG-8B-R24-01]
MADTKDEKAERLAAALRENLKRRKAQARAAGRGHQAIGAHFSVSHARSSASSSGLNTASTSA